MRDKTVKSSFIKVYTKIILNISKRTKKVQIYLTNVLVFTTFNIKLTFEVYGKFDRQFSYGKRFKVFKTNNGLYLNLKYLIFAKNKISKMPIGKVTNKNKKIKYICRRLEQFMNKKTNMFKKSTTSYTLILHIAEHLALHKQTKN